MVSILDIIENSDYLIKKRGKFMKTVKSIKNYPIIIYTIIFLFVFSLYYGLFLIEGKTLIWKSDGINQHFSILYDFNEIIRNFIKNPSNGIMEWSWNIGYGSDIIGAYSYYVIGDPFSYLSLLFPLDKLEIVYDFLITLRLYFAGLAFTLYCRRMRFSNYGTILGSISYSFSGFIIMSAIRHPYFINPLIILPLVFICIENILDNKKKYLFSIIVSVSMISNFYFAYMLAIISIIYSFLRYFELKNLKNIKFSRYFFNLLLYFIIGILISSVIFLPTLYSILTSSRILSDNTQQSILIYPIAYYINLIYSSISSGSYPFWTVLTLPALTFILLPLFVRDRKSHKTYFYMTIIFFIMILIPFFGSAMNGFSSISNRWSFVFAFISSLIIVLGFDNIKSINKVDILWSIVILSIFFVFGIIKLKFPKVKNEVFPSVFLGIITIGFILYYLKLKRKNILKNNRILFFGLCILLSLNIIFNNYYRYSINGNNYIKEFLDRGEAFSYYKDSFNCAEKYIKSNDKSFYRISKADNVSRDKTRNNSIVLNYNGIDSFLSINNGYLAKFSRSLNNRAFTPNSPIINFDNRPIVSSLMGVKYYISKEDEDPRFNPLINKVKNIGEFSIYKNNNVLPFGYVYSNILDIGTFDSLNGLEKEEALVYCASVDSKYSNSNIKSIPSKLENIIFDTKNSTAKISYNKITVTKPNETVILNINNKSEGNIYVNIRNLKFTPFSKGLEEKGESKDFNNKIKHLVKNLYNINNGDGFKINASYKNISKNFNKPDGLDASGYFDMDNILYNLGYHNDLDSSEPIILTFKNPGEYSYDDLEVINLPIKKYDEEFKKLRSNNFVIDKVYNDKILGNINSSKDGILTFQIPYCRGWEVKVNGKKVEIFPVNKAFLGINIESGKSEIELKYKTPLLRIGLVITIIGITILLVFIILEKRNKDT